MYTFSFLLEFTFITNTLSMSDLFDTLSYKVHQHLPKGTTRKDLQHIRIIFISYSCWLTVPLLN